MTYVDGCLLAVPKANKDAYVAYAKWAADLFKEYGASALVDNWGEDVPDGKVNSLNSAVLRKPDEAVVFSWVVWPDKKTRDDGWAGLLADPRMASGPPMPFDGQRMIFGGFETIFEA